MRIATPKKPTHDWRADFFFSPSYDKSILLQRAGNPRGSTEAYLAALECQARLRSVPPPVGPEVQALPRDLYAAIFVRLSRKDLASASLVSRGWKRLARDPVYVTHRLCTIAATIILSEACLGCGVRSMRAGGPRTWRCS